MFANSIILAISSSIDSLGIGITYGIKNTKISIIGKVILFCISFFITLISIYFGNMIKNVFSEYTTKFLGSIILIFIGLFIIYQSLKEDTPITYDLDNSKIIDPRESIFLGLALSLDSFCIGIGGSIIGINYFLFPFFTSIFQTFFLNFGNFLGRKIYKLGKLPNNIWSIISGIILVFIGILRFF